MSYKRLFFNRVFFVLYLSIFCLEAYCSVGEKRTRDGIGLPRPSSPILVLEDVSPIIMPIGRIVGDAPLSRPDGVKFDDFYQRILSEQECVILRSFCAQIQMEPSYWKTGIKNIKKELSWPDERSSYKFWLDEKEVSIDDGIQKYLACRGCGLVPIIYVQDSESDDGGLVSIIEFRGTSIYIHPEFFKLTRSEQCANLDEGLTYFQNNDAFNIQFMHRNTIQADPSNQPALENIMNIYMKFARRRNDLAFALNGCDKKRLDDTSLVDYVEEFVKMRSDDAKEIVSPWLRSLKGPSKEDKGLEVVAEDAMATQDLVAKGSDDGIGEVLWSHMERGRSF